ncbi:hypothetical protein G5I_00410 [Acromyrmex echinatior]|uniref:DUF4817 domain-containing protein n=1 Tax=Acromyrmex echinatior TaxID=103372 RepID=F4W4T5_ACREC|nr:hypothetical protein G5I_00410 [Acromyrmex echinatior]
MATPNELQTRNFDSLLVIPSAARNNMFSLEERFEILKTYFQSQCCVAETVRILKRNMGRDRAPTEGAIRKLVRKVREKGIAQLAHLLAATLGKGKPEETLLDAFSNVNLRCELADDELDHMIFEQFECQELIPNAAELSASSVFESVAARFALEMLIANADEMTCSRKMLPNDFRGKRANGRFQFAMPNQLNAPA